MATFDSAWCLNEFNTLAGRPTADAITDPSKYARLTKAQNRVVAMIATVAPSSLYQKVGYGSLPTLSTTDHQVFTFGTDSNSYPIMPIGKVGIYPSLTAIPDYPWREGWDYLNEGTQIRIPNNGTYAGTLYWRGIVNPPDITASTQPSLYPEAARELITIEAVRQFAKEAGRNPQLAADMDDEWNRAWPTWCLVWKTQFRQGGALASYAGRDLAVLAPSTSPI